MEINETAAARHNLALTELQLENPAKAVWQLERALLLNPSNPDYRNKLNLVREQLGLAASSPKWYVRVIQLIPQAVWITIASLSFWLLLALLILPKVSGKKIGNWVQFGRLFSLLALAVSILAVKTVVHESLVTLLETFKG